MRGRAPVRRPSYVFPTEPITTGGAVIGGADAIEPFAREGGTPVSWGEGAGEFGTPIMPYRPTTEAVQRPVVQRIEPVLIATARKEVVPAVAPVATTIIARPPSLPSEASGVYTLESALPPAALAPIADSNPSISGAPIARTATAALLPGPNVAAAQPAAAAPAPPLGEFGSFVNSRETSPSALPLPAFAACPPALDLAGTSSRTVPPTDEAHRRPSDVVAGDGQRASVALSSLTRRRLQQQQREVAQHEEIEKRSHPGSEDAATPGLRSPSHRGTLTPAEATMPRREGTPAVGAPAGSVKTPRTGMLLANTANALHRRPEDRAITFKTVLDAGREGLPEEVEGTDNAELALPWEYRDVLSQQSFCQFATRGAFWDRIQWCLRFALIACMPCVVVEFHPTTTAFFKSPGSLLVFAVVCTSPTLGMSIANLIDCFKLVAFLLVSLTAVFAVNVARHWALWGATFFFGAFCIVFFTSHITTLKNGLVMWTVAMMTHYMGWSDDGIMYPSYMSRDVLIGCGFGVASAILPYPRFNYAIAKEAERHLADCTGVCLVGLSETFFNDNAMQKTANLVKLRYTRSLLDGHIADLAANIPLAAFEPVWGLRVAQLQGKVALYGELARCIDSLLAVTEYQLESDIQSGVAHSKLLKAFRESFGSRFTVAARALDQLLHLLLTRRYLADDVERLKAMRDELHLAFLDALDVAQLQAAEVTMTFGGLSRHASFAESLDTSDIDPTMSLEFFPRRSLGYFSCNVTRCIDCLLAYKEPDVWTISQNLKSWLCDMPRETLAATWALLKGLKDGEMQSKIQLVHAMKVAGAMTTAGGIALYIKSLDVVGPPLIIGLVAGTSTSQTLRTAIEQLVGAVFGSTFAFVLLNIDSSLMGLSLSIIGIALVTTFLRAGRSSGTAAFFSQFSAVNMIKLNLSGAVALTQIQQTLMAIIFFVLVSSLIYPIRPSEELFKEIHKGFEVVQHSIATVFTTLCETGATHTTEAQMNELLGAQQLLRTSINSQKSLCEATSTEPGLSQRDFPLYLAVAMTDQMNRIEALLTPLVVAWKVLLSSPTSQTDMVMQAITPFLMGLTQETEILMGRLALCLKRGAGALAPLLVQSCVKLENISTALDAAERKATVILLRRIRKDMVEGPAVNQSFSEQHRAALETEARVHSPCPSPRGAVGVQPDTPPAILTIVHCCTTLTHELFALNICVTEFLFAVEAM